MDGTHSVSNVSRCQVRVLEQGDYRILLEWTMSQTRHRAHSR